MNFIWSNIHLTLPSIWTMSPSIPKQWLKFRKSRYSSDQRYSDIDAFLITFQRIFLQSYKDWISSLLFSLLCILYLDFCVYKCGFSECYYIFLWAIWEITAFICLLAFTMSGFWKITSQCSQIPVIRSLSVCSYLYV